MKKVAIFLLAFVSLLVNYDAALSKSSPIVQAQSFMKKGKCKEAIKILKKHAKTLSNHYAFYLELGNAYFLCNEKEKAFLNYKKGFKLNSKNVYLCESMARTALEIKKYKEAAQTFNLCSNLDKRKKSNYLFMSAYAYYMDGKFNNALDILQDLITDPTKAPAEWIKLLLNSALEAKKWTLVKKAALTLIDRHPENSSFWKFLALSEEQQNKFLNAAAALDIMQSLENQKDEAIERALMSYYTKAGVFRKAVEIFEELNTNTKEDLEKLVQLYLACGKVEEALQLLDNAFKITGDYSFLIKKGKLLIQKGDYSHGIKVLEGVLSQQKESLPCLLWIAIGNIYKEDFERAESLLLEADKICKESPEVQTDCENIEKLSSIIELDRFYRPEFPEN